MREISEVVTDELLYMVNKALSDGISVNKFSKDMGWNSSSVKTKLKRGGYGYNANLKKYVLKDETNINITTKSNTKSDTKISTKSVVNTNENLIIKNTKKNINNNTKKSIVKEKNNLEIDVLLERLDNIEKRLLNLESNRNSIRSSKINKYVINNTRDTSTKSIRLYTEVKEQLDEYLSKHNNKKVIEVFSYAILDYINRYK